MNKCIGLGKIFGHNFKSRYSSIPPPYSVKFGYFFDSRDAERLIKTLTTRKYNGDVCTRCGLTVNKESK